MLGRLPASSTLAILALLAGSDGPALSRCKKTDNDSVYDPIRTKKDNRRNNPCSCGSRIKFKKCCRNKKETPQ